MSAIMSQGRSISTYIKHRECIFGFFQRLPVGWGNVRFVTAESNACSIADGEGEAKGDELASIDIQQGVYWVGKKGEMAHGGDEDGIVIIAHSLHHTQAGDESEYDEGSRYAEKCYHHGKHRWPAILHGQGGRVGHDCSRHSRTASENIVLSWDFVWEYGLRKYLVLFPFFYFELT